MSRLCIHILNGRVVAMPRLCNAVALPNCPTPLSACDRQEAWDTHAEQDTVTRCCHRRRILSCRCQQLNCVSRPPFNAAFIDCRDRGRSWHWSHSEPMLSQCVVYCMPSHPMRYRTVNLYTSTNGCMAHAVCVWTGRHSLTAEAVGEELEICLSQPPSPSLDVR